LYDGGASLVFWAKHMSDVPPVRLNPILVSVGIWIHLTEPYGHEP